MRLDPRILLPAALVAGALALPSVGAADPPPTHVFCPNPNSDWMLTSTVIAPSAASKDNNGDTLVCQKREGQYKDNNNPMPPSNNPDDYVDAITE
jgi:hypothetical protein